MRDCDWESYDGKFKCKQCGYIISQPIKKNCFSTPSLLKRGINLTKAAVKHVATGMQHCSTEERQSRLDICQSNKCGLFRKFSEDSPTGVCAHDDCGCFIRSNGKFLDKLSWAESKCPVGLWGPVEPKNIENPENGV